MAIRRRVMLTSRTNGPISYVFMSQSCPSSCVNADLCQNLPDFSASGALTYFSYAWLWFLAIVAVAVYASDTFTAVNLLAYDKWSSQIQPSIPLEYSKWIFAVCIIISWVLCAFEWVRAIRVIRRDSVAESYMDPLAVTLQSMRPQGWKRFLVFAELTKSKKGLDYLALFVYFQLKGALRIIVAEAPRQVVNGVTLYSVLQADLVTTGDHAASDGHSSIEQFFINIGTLADTDGREQAIVLFTMLFTFVIWVISALCLLAAVILYLTFIWHYIPQRDGRLSIFCRRKIDRRLTKVVSAKVKKALEDEEKQRLKSAAKPSKSHHDLPARPPTDRKPTLPVIGATTPRPNDGRLPDFKLAREDSQATVSSFGSQASTQVEKPLLPRQPTLSREPTLPDLHAMGPRPGMPSRSATDASNFSNISHESDAPLLRNATEMGYADECNMRPRPTMDRQTSGSSYGTRPAVGRQASASSYGSRAPFDRQGSSPSYGARPIIDRQISGSATGRGPPMRAMSPLTEVSMSNDGSERSSGPVSGPGAQYNNNPYGPERRFNPQEDDYPRLQDPLMRQGTQDSNFSTTSAPVRFQNQDQGQSFHRPIARPARAATAVPFSERFTPSPTPFGQAAATAVPFSERFTPSPAPSGQAFEMTTRPPPALLPRPSPSPSPAPGANGGGAYVAFNPRFASPGPHGAPPPRRNMTTPGNGLEAGVTHHFGVPQRSATAPPTDAAAAYDGIFDEYSGPPHHQQQHDFEVPTRSATAGPGGHERW